MAAKAETKVKIPLAMLSYPHLKDAQVDTNDDGTPKPDAKPKWSAVFVFAPGTDLTALKKAAFAAGVAKWGEEEFKKLAKSPNFRSGFRTDVEEKYLEGSTYINARTTVRPGIVYAWAGEDGKTPARVPLERVEEDLYPGCFVIATVVAFGYKVKGNMGIGWALNNIQKVKDGARLDSRVAAEKEFDVDLSAEPAANLDEMFG